MLEEHQNIQHSAFGPATDRLALILAGAMQQRSRFLGPIRALMTTPVRAKPTRTGEPRENARSPDGPSE